MAKTVQILGKGRGTSVPFPPEAERWGINDLIYLRYNGEFDDWTRWFDLHHSERILTKRPQAWEWYKQQVKPIYLLEPDLDIPASLAYPKAEILDYFGTKRFGSSFDWMMALAIYEKFEQIELCWCRMLQQIEHQKQIPTATYWIGQAEARGIKVKIHGESGLQPNPLLYGFQVTYN